MCGSSRRQSAPAFIRIYPAIRRALVGLSLALCSALATASALDIAALTDSLFPQAEVAVYLKSLTNQRVLLAHHSDTLLYPASTTKLGTSIAAYAALPEDFQFETQLVVAPEDTLWVIMDGDPTLTEDTFVDMLTALPHPESIEHIHVVGDKGYPNLRNPDLFYADQPWYFAASAGDFMINANAIPISIDATGSLGSKASIRLNAQSGSLRHNVTIVTPEEAEDYCAFHVDSQKNNHWVITGCWPQGERVIQQSLSLTDPKRYLEALTLETLIQLGAHPKVVQADKPPRLPDPVVSHVSAKRNALIREMNLFSDNVVADQLFYRLTPDTHTPLHAARRWVRDFFERELGMPSDSFRQLDGSGGSRLNVLTAQQIGHWLEYIHQHRPLFQTLPALGEGSLRYRFLDKAPFPMRAKTGTVTGTHALSGVFTTPDQEHVAFVIVVQNTLWSRRDAQSRIDALLLDIQQELWS